MVTLFLALYLRSSGALQDRLTDRERGQGTLEYVGMIAVVAIVVVAVATIIKGADLGGVVSTAINNVKSAVSG